MSTRKSSTRKPKAKSTARPRAKAAASRSSSESEVDAFLSALDPPRKAELEAVRAILLGASPAITEGIKWKAPSFRTSEYFATLNHRNGSVLLILHLGAKVKDNATAGLVIRDPAGLLEWLSKDRCAVRFRDLASIRAKKAALADIVRQWIVYVR